MATIADHPAGNRSGASEHRFYTITAWLIAVLVTAGFSLNLAAGRSSFDVPFLYHLHAVVFFGYVALYVSQATLAGRGSLALHMRLGQIAVVWIPLMLVLGVLLTFETLRVLGGPGVFGQSEFLAVNLTHLAAFGGLAFVALRLRKRPDWHKRLMFGAFVTVSIPGIARLLPLPLLVPYAFPAIFLFVSIFPLWGMWRDKRQSGMIHPAWWWVLLVPLVALALGEIIGATGYANDWVVGHVSGTPGGERPPEAFLTEL